MFTWLITLIKSLKPKLKAKKIAISIEDNNDGFSFETYASKLAQVITNLVANCVLHAFEIYQVGDNNKINIYYKYDENSLLISVRDNGCGMRPEMLKNAIEPFITTKRGQGGTGLGLTIVSNIIYSVFDGEFKIHSTLGKGTEFQVKIPFNGRQH